MEKFVIIEYDNYRKEVSVSVIAVFNTLEQSIDFMNKNKLEIFHLTKEEEATTEIIDIGRDGQPIDSKYGEIELYVWFSDKKDIGEFVAGKVAYDTKGEYFYSSTFIIAKTPFYE